MTVRRYAVRAGILVLSFLLADLACDRLLLSDDFFLGRPVGPFDPPLFSPSQWQTLRKIEADLNTAKPGSPSKFEPELGWCNRPESGFGDYRYDWAGARIGITPLAHVKPAGVRRVLALGCSMTHGEEVGPREAWCSRIDEAREDLEVANLGVAAYGIDQALLRLRREGSKLDADEVWLGVLPSAALRVTTLYRPLLDHWSLDVAFKPRFELAENGALELIPSPVARLEDIPRLLHDQRAFLAALGDRDPWIERAPLAYEPRGSHWTHHFFTSRLVLTLLEAGGREVETCFADPPSESGLLFTAIVRAIAEQSRSLGASFRLLLLPGKDDLLQRIREGRGYWEDWGQRMRAERLAVLDVSNALLSRGRELDGLFAPHGHYTSEASRLVAEAILAEVGR